VLQRDGADFSARYGWNQQASDDEWASPIMAEVGPDGSLSYVDALIQDNITQYQTGGANAIKTSLAAEQRYYSLLRFILDEIKKLEDKLAANEELLPNCFDMQLTPELTKAKNDATINISVSSTTLSILTVLDQQFDSATDATVRNGVLTTYANYRNQGFFRTNYQNEELKISYIDMEFAQMTEKFRYDTAVERQRCGGSFDYTGVLTR
jgi:hypothetical protein